MLSLLTAEKSFDDPWVGSTWLNKKLHLHALRIRLAASCAQLRAARAQRSAAPPRVLEAAARLADEGCCSLPHALPDALFAPLAAEAPSAEAVDAARRALAPILDNIARRAIGRPFPMETAALSRCECAVPPPKAAAAQELWHRDAFCPGLRFWLTLTPVTAADGPLLYMPGSHRLSAERLEWEEMVARRCASLRGATLNKSGRFLMSDVEARRLGGVPERFTAEPNTLIVINTFGIHARMLAERTGTRRALQGRYTPPPFATWAG
ncbi:MAG: phytanoyl-CoA dioxygenase family protein [Pseudomonadota bacterium]